MGLPDCEAAQAMVTAVKLQHTWAIISLHLTPRILPLLLSVRQLQNDTNGAMGDSPCDEAGIVVARAVTGMRAPIIFGL